MHTFASPIERAVRTRGRAEAVVCGDERLTFAQVVGRARRLVGGLRDLGVASGDRVAILAANCHRYVETYLGVPAAGLVVVPLNTRHAEPELLYALEDSGAKVLITDRDPGSLAKAVDHVVAAPDEYESLVASAAEVELGVGVTEETLAGLFYTGGTTGASKGVMLSHRNLIANTFHVLVTQQTLADDRFSLLAPMFHAAGSFTLLAAVWQGAAQAVLPAFEAAAALDLIERERITSTLVVPTMLAAMAEEQLARPRDTSSLRYLGHGGSPVATEVVRRAHQAFPTAELIHYYGATETAPIATALTREQDHLDDDRARSCGLATVGLDVRIFDADDDELPAGAIGEVVIRGPNVMVGYWNKPDQTAEALRGGWYHSGDLGYQDEEGYVFLVDRAKDMIVSGGENVYCTEVEEVLYQHPMVLEAAVFGVPDEKWGEAVHAVVVPRGKVDPGELIAFCTERIAGYKIPKTVELRADPLPKSGPGKVLKRELRAPFWESRDLSIN